MAHRAGRCASDPRPRCRWVGRDEQLCPRLQGYRGFRRLHGVEVRGRGLVQALAQELGPDSIRVNSVLPTSVDTPMINGEEHRRRMTSGSGSMDEQQALYRAGHLMPVGWIQPQDVANAVLWLLSDESRYVTGVNLPIDAGYLAKAVSSAVTTSQGPGNLT